MAAIDFPTSPATGQLFSAANGVTYQWNGTLWLVTAGPGGGTGDFCASQSGTISLPTTAAVTTGMPVVSGNSGSWYVSGTGRYTPPAGRFYLYGAIQGFKTSGTTDVQTQIRKNGAVAFTSTGAAAATSGSAVVDVSGTLDANGSDYFELWTAGTASSSQGMNVVFGAFPLTGMQGPAGPPGPTSNLLQTVFTETGAVATGTTIVPVDDTIPQITEGDQYMTCTITPKSATSKLHILVTAHLTHSTTGGTTAAALFQDATANALAAGIQVLPVSGGIGIFTFSHVMTSGTTSATTFRVRAGGGAAGTTTFNGSGGARYYGGAIASSIVIEEVV